MNPKQVKDLLVSQIRLISANAKSFVLIPKRIFQEQES